MKWPALLVLASLVIFAAAAPPVRFVTPQSPPTLLVHGTAADVVSIKHAERLRDVLQANHVRVETQFYPGKRHADTVAGFSVPARERTPVLEQSVSFIESVTR
jgi:dipeptidyl aminopeptidase/acylaminoacyl peptidase